MPHTLPSPTTAPAANTQATEAATAPVALSLDERLALIDVAMSVRLNEAGLAYEVNTAHIHTEPVDLARVITAPEPTEPAVHPLPDLYLTPIAALLQRAHRRLLTGGWCKNTLVDAQGARCLWGAIQAEAASSREEADAVDILLEAIRRKFGPDVSSVPAFNDAWGRSNVPVRLLGEAADLAHARSV